jgi:hypothetical protein
VASPFDPNVRFTQAELRAAMRAIIRMFEDWELTPAEARRLLGGPDESTFHCWTSGEVEEVPTETALRPATLLSIQEELRLAFRVPDTGYSWIRKRNEALGGISALDRMMQGSLPDLVAVQEVLNARRVGGLPCQDGLERRRAAAERIGQQSQVVARYIASPQDAQDFYADWGTPMDPRS